MSNIKININGVAKTILYFHTPTTKKLIYTLQGSTCCTVATSALISIPFLMHPKTGVPDLSTSNQALLSTYAFTCFNNLLWFEVTNS